MVSNLARAAIPAAIEDLLDELPLGVLLATPDGVVESANVALAELLGHEATAARTLRGFWSSVVDDPRALVDLVERTEAAREVLEPGDVHGPPLGFVATHDGVSRSMLAYPATLGTRHLWMFAAAGEAAASDAGRSGVTSASVLELQARIEQLERQVMTDRLTGAWNRRYLEHAAAAEIPRARRYRQPLSALMLDVDHFKRINDEHGHPAGDAVLVELTRVVTAVLRASDALVRWGGEEFLVLAPMTSIEGAARFAWRILAAVEAHEFPHVGRVTLSAGVAEHQRDASLEDWLARADKALYAAKQAGRNRVECDDATASPVWDHGALSVLQLVWHDGYECGDGLIDGEHRELFESANALLAVALGADATTARVGACLHQMLEQIDQHFQHEEEVLAELAFDGLVAHASKHTELLERARVLSDAWASGDAHVGRVIEFVARDVVAAHLLRADRAFFPLFDDA